MKIKNDLRGAKRIFLDTAPVIYYVEQHPRYLSLLQVVFDQIDDGSLVAVTSPITLAEALAAPCRQGLASLQQDFYELIVYGHNTLFVSIDHDCALQAAELIGRYDLALNDAFQIVVALAAGCDLFLTNDPGLQRVTDLRVLVLDQY
jgi:predicted nucleic acid-binding protein